jgi:hypothetical protein
MLSIKGPLRILVGDRDMLRPGEAGGNNHLVLGAGVCGAFGRVPAGIAALSGSAILPDNGWTSQLEYEKRRLFLPDTEVAEPTRISRMCE